MEKSVFDTSFQQESVSNKIVIGLERISEVFRTLLWAEAKKSGVSPIQIQILIFIAYHKSSLCTVSYLAKEFDLTKPTISDAVKSLEQKKLILKDYSGADSRSFLIVLSEKGKELVSVTENYANPLKKQFDSFDEEQLETVYEAIVKLIYNLNKAGIISVQRTCFACKFHSKKDGGDYCEYLQKPLKTEAIRVDCPEFEEKAS
ncbi:MarR family winged helix-turn-helix transcriptional regulator [Aequorivita sp. F47161]|uniref:MarR family winged helix-turn-helix transcriptional regulator n=1 Tax=Aequorivita vitellina TaxID=2874475 RepID=A0A9X1QVW7_9FLAO|nr:MarR family winged helix-turn-helix transcriptional regulator [Aequorivita vitellina]MCG2418372.1 MarR family winged helix-turn-helix transcriptional regulator [Aequorivita vitellina]